MLLTYKDMDLLDVEKGIICQQVNCRNTYGRGISGAIAKKYPIVEEKYHKSFEELLYGHCHIMHKAQEYMLGYKQVIKVTDDLYVANIYSQLDYGNAYKTKICYTNIDKLISGLKYVVELALCSKEYMPVYIPYRIGCGLAGGDWNELYRNLSFSPPYDGKIIICKREQDK